MLLGEGEEFIVFPNFSRSVDGKDRQEMEGGRRRSEVEEWRNK